MSEQDAATRVARAMLANTIRDATHGRDGVRTLCGQVSFLDRSIRLNTDGRRPTCVTCAAAWDKGQRGG